MTRTAGAYLTANLVESLIRGGRWEEAQPIIDDAIDWNLSGVFAGIALVMRAELDALRGRYESAAGDLEGVRRLFAGSDDPLDLE